MPIVKASLHAKEAASQIVSYAKTEKFKYVAERMLHTPLYNDNNHLENVAVMDGRVVAYFSLTLDWNTMKSTSCSAVSFEENPLTIRLIIKSAYAAFKMGFSEINFAACAGNTTAVAMWDRVTQTWFEGGRSYEDFKTTTHTGEHEMITWRVFPKREKMLKAS